MPSSRDSISNTLIVAISVSLVCSVLVSATAVVLRPQQEQNKALYRQKIVLEVAGLYDPDIDVSSQFEKIDARLVELSSGNYIDSIDVSQFDADAASRDPNLSAVVPDEYDVASIKRRAIYAPVYVIANGAAIDQVILPIRGAGLWSTMHGYLAVEADGRTIRGLQFYEHAETPGLGDQIDKSAWRSQWSGKQIYDTSGELRIEVVRGRAQPGDDLRYQVDGLSGATLTGRGVTNLLHYWAGPNGFGPYLDRLAKEANRDD